MKHLKLLLFAVFGLTQASVAQQKVKDKAIIKTPGVDCGNDCDICKTRIELYVARQYGVTSVKVDVKKKTTTVTWLTDRTNIEEIKTAIANTGFDADDVTADETAYKRLPPACKKAVSAAPGSSKN